jgi:hypothetical protein
MIAKIVVHGGAVPKAEPILENSGRALFDRDLS